MVIIHDSTPVTSHQPHFPSPIFLFISRSLSLSSKRNNNNNTMSSNDNSNSSSSSAHNIIVQNVLDPTSDTIKCINSPAVLNELLVFGNTDPPRIQQAPPGPLRQYQDGSQSLPFLPTNHPLHINNVECTTSQDLESIKQLLLCDICQTFLAVHGISCSTGSCRICIVCKETSPVHKDTTILTTCHCENARPTRFDNKCTSSSKTIARIVKHLSATTLVRCPIHDRAFSLEPHTSDIDIGLNADTDAHRHISNDWSAHSVPPGPIPAIVIQSVIPGNQLEMIDWGSPLPPQDEPPTSDFEFSFDEMGMAAAPVAADPGSPLFVFDTTGSP